RLLNRLFWGDFPRGRRASCVASAALEFVMPRVLLVDAPANLAEVRGIMKRLEQAWLCGVVAEQTQLGAVGRARRVGDGVYGDLLRRRQDLDLGLRGAGEDQCIAQEILR